MFKKLIITFLFLSFCSCGFRVIYNENDKDAEFNYENELAAIRIKKNRTKLDQDLKNNLYDLLNPDYIEIEPKYFLILTSKKSTTSTFTTVSGASGRNRDFVNVKYELRNLANGELISQGEVTLNDNYDVTQNRYATYVADEYVTSNLVKSLAKNLRYSLVNDLIEMKKKEANTKKDSIEERKSKTLAK